MTNRINLFVRLLFRILFDKASSSSGQIKFKPDGETTLQMDRGPSEKKSAEICETDISFFQESIHYLKTMLHQKIIGQEQLLNHLIMALLGGGHILVEGVPGLAKTLAVKMLAASIRLDYRRIQFTPDLLPADLTGTTVFEKNTNQFKLRRGPIFTQVLLADEINRAPAKVQSALLEAMAEKQVTIGETSHQLAWPFFVMATQNPLEEEGTYPLPAAQLDRFDLKFIVHYPNPEEELQLLTEHPALGRPERDEDNAAAPMTVENIQRIQGLIAKVQVSEQVMRYIINIVNATRETNKRLKFSHLIDLGASPRASLALYRYSAIQALFCQRNYVLPIDVKAVCPSVLRHRLVLSYEAEAENQTSDDVIEQILSAVAVP